MYDYRKMSPRERHAILQQRKVEGLPWHTPPHYADGSKCYLVTAACWEHQDLLSTSKRLSEWENKLRALVCEAPESEIRGWVVLPNHYHILVRANLEVLGSRLGRLHNGVSTQWNREDNTMGRKVWYRFSDRAIRSERHYYAALNYVHSNPVKHGYVEHPEDWPWSSLHLYVESFGYKDIADWMERYPPDRMGEKWD